MKKIAGSEETIFVYDAGGKLIGEYSSIVQTGRNAKTVYTANDHLGSPRVNTDGVGTVISRHDYHALASINEIPTRYAGVTDNDRPYRLRFWAAMDREPPRQRSGCRPSFVRRDFRSIIRD